MNNLVISYLTMRKAIGILAFALPFMLIFGALMSGWAPMQTSFSAYYWTTANPIFVGMLVTMGVFLLSYNGYDKRDRLITSISGVAIILVALFPCEGGDSFLFGFLGSVGNNIVHYISALITFASLGVMSYFQFTLGGKNPTPAKLKRNKIYRACGLTIFGAIVVIAIVTLIPGAREFTDSFRLFFWLEAVIVWAFGLSWLVKGETLLKDE